MEEIQHRVLMVEIWYVGMICQSLFRYTVYTRPGVDNTKLLLFERGSIRVKIVLLLYLLQLDELVSGSVSVSLATNRAAIYLLQEGQGDFGITYLHSVLSVRGQPLHMT